MPKLSVCMIVRDEAEQLPGCLESLQGLAAELIVVDTGSTDETVAIARRYGARVEQFTWINDFAAARNDSLRYASGDWRLWLDADERIDPASADLLHNLPPRAKRPTIYQVHMRNFRPGGQQVTMSMSHRLISHHRQIRFSGRIHEQVQASLKAAGGVEKPSSLILDHHGYDLEGEAMAAKLRRNRPLLEAMVREEGSTYALFTLGQNYAMSDETEAALDTFRKAAAAGGFQGLSLVPLLNNMAESCWKLEQLDEAEQFAQQSLELTTQQTGGHFILYRILKARGDLAGQIACLQAVLEMSRKGERGEIGPVAQDVVIASRFVLFSLAGLHLAAENFIGAEEAIRDCLAIIPDEPEAVAVLWSALAGQNRWGDIVDAANIMVAPLSQRLRELQGLAYIKLGEMAQAVAHYEAWFAEHPDLAEVGRRLAGLYAHAGRAADAEALLNRLAEENH